MVGIEGSPNLARDLHSHAVINKDINGLKAHLAAREKRINDAQKMANLEADVAQLKSSVEEILRILKGK